MSNTTSFLERMLQPVADAMPVEFARKLVSLRADDELMAQVEPLREKASIVPPLLAHLIGSGD